jgi:hypothetical protein
MYNYKDLGFYWEDVWGATSGVKDDIVNIENS